MQVGIRTPADITALRAIPLRTVEDVMVFAHALGACFSARGWVHDYALRHGRLSPARAMWEAVPERRLDWMFWLVAHYRPTSGANMCRAIVPDKYYKRLNMYDRGYVSSEMTYLNGQHVTGRGALFSTIAIYTCVSSAVRHMHEYQSEVHAIMRRNW